MPEKIHHAVPAGKEEPRDSEQEEKATGWLRIVWIVVAVLSGAYILYPEPSDLFPIIGWLDEGLAAVFLTTALGKLGIRIPILDAFIRRKGRKSSKASAKDAS
ncbi:MAG: hypothetical protein RH862_00495 [Leptospiraceae bacterium]